MVKPSESQQLRARSRIRAIVEMRNDGNTVVRPGQLPRYVFSHKRGIIAGQVGIKTVEGNVTDVRDIYSEVPKYNLGFADTFGFPKVKRTEGKTKASAKLRIGKLLGYKGSETNIIRSVNRVIMRNRQSPQARNLRSVEQVNKIDNSFHY